MKKKTTYKFKTKSSIVNEPLTVYGTNPLFIFNSFEEEEEFKLQKMAKLTHRQLMDKLEAMRRIFFKNYLLPNGKWKLIERVITIQSAFK